MREQLLISAFLWWAFEEQELGDSSQRLATGRAVNVGEKMEDACDLPRRTMSQCRVRENIFWLV